MRGWFSWRQSMVGLGSVALLVWLQGCAATAPPPTAEKPPEVAEVVAAPVPETAPAVFAWVTGSTLNVREGAGTGHKVVGSARRGERLAVVGEDGEWLKVQLGPEKTGFVHGKFVSRNDPCPADKNTAEILNEPDVVLRPAGVGRVVLEATVSPRGEVTTVKFVENSTGSEEFRRQAEGELRALRFSPPIRNCKPRSFIYVYSRAF